MDDDGDTDLAKMDDDGDTDLAKMDDDGDTDLARTRAAPTRRRNYVDSSPKRADRDSSAAAPQVGDNTAEDFIRGVTGKRFSISELFKRRSKKETSEDKNKERDSNSKTEAQVDTNT